MFGHTLEADDATCATANQSGAGEPHSNILRMLFDPGEARNISIQFCLIAGSQSQADPQEQWLQEISGILNSEPQPSRYVLASRTCSVRSTRANTKQRIGVHERAAAAVAEPKSCMKNRGIETESFQGCGLGPGLNSWRGLAGTLCWRLCSERNQEAMRDLFLRRVYWCTVMLAHGR